MFLVASLITIVISFTNSPAAAQSGRKFYIDYTSGSNSNPGTQAAPWKTHPFMQTGAGCTATGSAPSYAHQAGDQFIFKGGVTWPYPCFTFVPTQGGTSSAQDYYGVDKTWYSGGSWTRPIWDLTQHAPTPASGYSSNVFQMLAAYITLDNIEIKNHQVSNNSGNNCQQSGISGDTGGNTHFTGLIVKNVYIHDWVVNGAYSGTMNGTHSGGGICRVDVVDSVEASDLNGAIVGPGAGPLRWGACFSDIYVELKNSKCHDAGEGIASAFFNIHDNEFYNIVNDSAYHCTGCSGLGLQHLNVIEDTGYGTAVIYNNSIHDNNVPVIMNVCASDTVYNNVMWNNNGLGFSATSIGFGNPNACANESTSTARAYNNTVDCSTGQFCVRTGGGGAEQFANLYINNNIFITNSGAISIQTGAVGGTISTDNTYSMQTSEASTYGFTPANKYAPTSSDPHIVGQGRNLGSSCSGHLEALCEDTGGAPWYGGTPVARSTTWDLGAFASGAQAPQKTSNPNPPVGLSATVQ
jgi:hypothetical protein